MININNKEWGKLRLSDIQKHLSGDDDESFFFEYKEDDVKPDHLIKEVSAFANTYGGYIIIGVNDNKEIIGCSKWTETIRNALLSARTAERKRSACSAWRRRRISTTRTPPVSGSISPSVRRSFPAASPALARSIREI